MRGGSTVDNKAKNRSISEWLSSLIKFNSPDTIVIPFSNRKNNGIIKAPNRLLSLILSLTKNDKDSSQEGA